MTPSAEAAPDCAKSWSAEIIQVTYATHSPYFLETRHFDQVRRLTRSYGENPVVTVHFATVTVTDVKAKLNGVLDVNKVDNQLDAFVANELGS